MSTTRAAHRPPLSALESAVLRQVWRLRAASVEAVHEALAGERTLKEATTRTILRRLEAKGYIYRAVEAPRSVAVRAVRQIIDRFCHGSVEELVSGLVEGKVLTRKELTTLEALLRQKKGKPS
jgi:predicted transcriptional regulator